MCQDLDIREIHIDTITDAVEKLCINANYNLNDDIADALKQGIQKEESTIGKEILENIVKNSEIAKNEQIAMCQDTGVAVVFVEIGQDVRVVGGSLETAINEGVRRGYTKGYLRKSMVKDPLDRVNTGDNTPAVIYYSIIEGHHLNIEVAPKGIGSENMSALKMLKPSDGVEGVKRFILETVDNAGPNPCPPIIVGVGIGGTMEKAALMSKMALLRPINKRNSHSFYKELEEELLEEINKSGIGPQGLGGRVTALAVNIEYFPTHIAGLPVAVNIGCHATRHAGVHL